MTGRTSTSACTAGPPSSGMSSSRPPARSRPPTSGTSAPPTRRSSRCTAGPCSTHPTATPTGRRSEHPQLGEVEIGGWDEVFLWGNAPGSKLLDEVRPARRVRGLPGDVLTPTGGAPHRGDRPRRRDLAGGGGHRQHRVAAHQRHGEGREGTAGAAVGGRTLGCLGGGRHGAARTGPARRPAEHATQLGKNDGTPDRVLATWLVQAPAGTEVTVAVQHQRAGSTTARISLQ